MLAHILAITGLPVHLLSATLWHLAGSPTGSGPTPPSGAPTGLGDALNRVSAIADFISSHFLLIGVSLCTLIFGWGGLLWIVSGANPQLRRTAVSTWWHAAIGLIGVVATTPIVTSIKGFFS
jgi:hypothetical protein